MMYDHFIHTPSDSRIFVFGSNLLGIHGAGAARYAYDKLGAKWGTGEGFFGRCYALPTCSSPGVPLLLSEVEYHTRGFLAFARTVAGSSARFFVSEVGCGLAGFSTEQIAPLFAGAPENCDLPPGWRL